MILPFVGWLIPGKTVVYNCQQLTRKAVTGVLNFIIKCYDVKMKIGRTFFDQITVCRAIEFIVRFKKTLIIDCLV